MKTFTLFVILSLALTGTCFGAELEARPPEVLKQILNKDHL